MLNHQQKSTKPPFVVVVIDSGKHAGRRFLYHQECISIGREEDNDLIIFQDKSVSSHHARLTYRANAWYLEDCNSKNGIFVEKPEGIHRLSSSMVIEVDEPFIVGKTRLHYEPEPADHFTCAQPQQHTLRITRHGDTLLWQFERSKAYNAVYESSLDPTALDWIQRQLSIVLAAAYKNTPIDRTAAPHRREMLQQLGEYITTHFIPPRIQAKLAAIAGDTLLIMHDLDTMTIPWELSCINGDFLCLQYELSRQLIAREQSVLLRQDRAIKSTEMLMLVNPTGDLPEAQEQAELLFDNLSALQKNVRISFISEDRIERADVLHRLAHADIVYYLGHAAYNDKDPSLSAWRLSSGNITAQDFQRLPNTPRFVFANGCETARHQPLHREAHGLASAFIVNGVEHYLGAIAPISVQGGLLFAEALFQHLFEGRSIGESVRQSRLYLGKTLDYKDPIWAMYSLYGDPTGMLP